MPALHALVVEDDHDIGLLLARRLERMDLTVRITVSGHAAIVSAGTERPDIVLLDLNLPDMDGAEVLRALRAAPDGARIPVLVVSIDEPGGDRTLDVDGWLVKPFRGVDVDDEVDRLLMSREPLDQPLVH